MLDSTYDSIWENIISPIADNICDGDFVFFNRNCKNRIHNKYIVERNKIKNEYMEESGDNIDRHKIAALMMLAIIECKPISISKKHVIKLFLNKEKLDKRYVYANEYLALYTAFSILQKFLSQDNKGVRLFIPKPFNESDYVLNTCIDLFFAKNSNKINVLTYANVFFLIESLSNEKMKAEQIS